MSEFEVFLSSKGPTLLEGEQKLKVMDAVIRGRSQFGDIVSYTGLAKSSASVNLSKLAEEGLVRTQGEGNDKRFFPSSIRIIRSVEPDPQGVINVLRLWDRKNDSEEGITPNNLERVMTAYLVIEARQHGVSLSPVLAETAKMLARAAFRLTEDNSIENVTKNICDFFQKSKYADVKMISVFPPTFDISLAFDLTDRTRHSFMEVVFRFITEYLSLTQKNELFVSNIEEIDGEIKTTRLTLGYKDVEPEFCNGIYHDFKFEEGESREFAVYKVEGSYAPVSDSLQMRILSCISKRPYSSRDLMGALKEPQTTIIGHLKKMEEAKLIKSFKNGNRSVYVMSSERIFSWSKPQGELTGAAKPYLAKAWGDPEHLAYYFINFLIIDSYEMGFDISALMTYLGKRIGEALVNMSPNITAESLFSILQKESKRIASSDLALKSYNPPTVIRITDYDMEPAVADCQRVFYNGVFSTIFGKLMHVEFVVKTDKVSGEGNRRYEASFMPKLE